MYKKWPKQVGEIEIFTNESFELLAKCFRAFDEDGYGWCGTNQNNNINDQKFAVGSDKGWGFCKKDCFPDPSEPMVGVLRYKDIHILNERYCEGQIDRKNLKVKPEVLCVGMNNSYKIKTYLKQGDRYHHIRLTDIKRFPVLKKLRELEDKWYVVGKNVSSSVHILLNGLYIV